MKFRIQHSDIKETKMAAYQDKLDGMQARLAAAQKAFKMYKAKDKDPKNKKGMYSSYLSAKSEIDGLKKRIATEKAKRAEENAKSKKAKTPEKEFAGVKFSKEAAAKRLLSAKRPTTKAERAKTLPVPKAPAKEPKVKNRKAELAAAREAKKGFSAEQTKGFSDKTGMTDAEAAFAGVVLGGGVGGAAFKAFMKIAGMNKVYDWFTTSAKKPTVAAVKDKIQKEVPKNSQDKLPTKFKPTKLDKKEAVVVPKKEAKPPQLRKPKEKPGTALVPVKTKLPAKPGTSVVPKAKRPPQGAPQITLKSEPAPVKAPKKLGPPSSKASVPPSPKQVRTGGGNRYKWHGENIAKAAIIPTIIPRGTEKEEVKDEPSGVGIEGIQDRTDQMGGEAPRIKPIKKKELISEPRLGRMLGLRRSKKEIDRDVAITDALEAGNYDKVAELEKEYGPASVKKSLTQRTKDYTPEQIEAMLHPDVKGSASETLKKLYDSIEHSDEDTEYMSEKPGMNMGGKVKKYKKKKKPVKMTKVYSNQPRKPSRA
tara:strand:+ start:72 stop:1676 length:1605 start_codon:yes stop_codon:yes gene_type:complete